MSDTSSVSVRSSNLELYRIVCMFLIVMHHYVVNSGIVPILYEAPLSAKSIYYFLFGMWGKVGINCFVLITGYFMCTKQITLRKFLKLLCEIYFYRWVIFIIFAITGFETITLSRIIKLLFPFWGVNNGFVDCFLLFYLLIPFLTVLVQHLTQKQHLYLVLGLLSVFSLLGTIPTFSISFNYVGWFCVLFVIASYIRLHPNVFFEKASLWGWSSLVLVLLSMISVVLCLWAQHRFSVDSHLAYWFVADSNKILAIGVALTSFLWFKNLKIKQSIFINTIAASTFGVLLIHANSDAMRKWLWSDCLAVASHYDQSWMSVLIHSWGGVALVFIICVLLDYLRIHLIERPIFNRFELK